MQALSIASTTKGYNPKMVRWIETKMTDLILSCLPPSRRALASNGALAHVLVMAFDGFVINQGLNPSAACSDAVVESICNAMLGKRAQAASRTQSSNKTWVVRERGKARVAAVRHIS
jgi:hypothetical protein